MAFGPKCNLNFIPIVFKNFFKAPKGLSFFPASQLSESIKSPKIDILVVVMMTRRVHDLPRPKQDLLVEEIGLLPALLPVSQADSHIHLTTMLGHVIMTRHTHT